MDVLRPNDGNTQQLGTKHICGQANQTKDLNLMVE